MQIRQFVVLHQVGTGGMGAVYSAYDTKLDRKVALKVLHSMPRNDQESSSSLAKVAQADSAQRERMLREAKAAARVTHPHVVSIYEVIEAEGTVCLAMEFVDGITLRAWQLARPRGWREVLDMYLSAGRGLAAVHAAGLIHRDFKPENVLVGRDGRPRVADFGIARLRSESFGDASLQVLSASDSGVIAPLSSQGVCCGTPGYMSPEQYDNCNIDTASDQFSFCAATFEALYGYLPFVGTSAAELSRSVRGPVRPPPASSPVPEEIFHILTRGLSAQPGARFPSMEALLSALTVERGQSVAAAAWSRRRIAVILITVIFCGWFSVQRASARYIRIAGPAFVVSLVVLTALLAAGYWHRRALISNRSHFSMWMLLLITVFQNLLLRLTAMLKPMAPFFVYYTVEMVVLVCSTLTIASLFVRPLLWLPLLPLVMGVLTFLELKVPLSLQLMVHPLTLSAILWGWHRIARSGLTHDSGAADAGGSAG